MTSPYPEKAVLLHELRREVQVFMSGIRTGKDFDAACEAAGVSSMTARAWLRDPVVAEHYENAKAGKGAPQVIGLGVRSTWSKPEVKPAGVEDLETEPASPDEEAE